MCNIRDCFNGQDTDHTVLEILSLLGENDTGDLFTFGINTQLNHYVAGKPDLGAWKLENRCFLSRLDILFWGTVSLLSAV